MVLQFRMTNRAEEYRIESTKLLNAIRRHHLVVLEVILRTPRKLDKVPFDAVFSGERFQNLERFVNDINTDTVSLDYRNAVFTQLETVPPNP